MDVLVEISELKKRIKRLEAAEAGAFLGLTDTPASYSGQGGKYTRVNSAQNALEFAGLTRELFFGRLTSDQNMPTGGTVYKVNINVADVDTLNGFDSTNKRYIIQNSGYFQIVGQWWKDGPDIEELYQAHIRINEAARLEPCAASTQYWMSDMVHHMAKSGGKDCTPRAFWPVKHLNAGDRVYLMANSYTTNQVIQGTEPYCGHKTYLSVVELLAD